MTEKMYTAENSEYLKNNPTWGVEDSPWKAGLILKMMQQNSMKPRSIAEVGCGAGEILNQLHELLPDDVSFTGYDISMDAIRLAEQRKKERLIFKHGNFLDINSSYDLLLLIDVFEHVEDYFGFLKSCKNRAEHIIFHIPLDISVHTILRNELMKSRKSVGHLHHFMKETALATLVDVGYEIVDFFYTAPSLDLPGKSILSKIAYLPRKLTYELSKDMAAKLFGGFSLLVLTK
jgi:SAM-dependent methyltransferase